MKNSSMQLLSILNKNIFILKDVQSRFNLCTYRSRQEEGEATLRIKPECFHVNSVTATSQPELEHTVKSELHSVTLRR